MADGDSRHALTPTTETTKGTTMKLYLQSAAGVALLLAAAIAETVEAHKRRAAR